VSPWRRGLAIKHFPLRATDSAARHAQRVGVLRETHPAGCKHSVLRDAESNMCLNTFIDVITALTPSPLARPSDNKKPFCVNTPELKESLWMKGILQCVANSDTLSRLMTSTWGLKERWQQLFQSKVLRLPTSSTQVVIVTATALTLCYIAVSSCVNTATSRDQNMLGMRTKHAFWKTFTIACFYSKKTCFSSFFKTLNKFQNKMFWCPFIAKPNVVSKVVLWSFLTAHGFPDNTGCAGFLISLSLQSRPERWSKLL